MRARTQAASSRCGRRCWRGAKCLRAAQALDDPIAQEMLDECRAARTDLGGLGQAPMPIVGEEGTRFGRQVIGTRAAAAGAATAQMRGDLPIILEDRYRQIGGAQPQRVTDQSERCGVQAVIELDVAIAMQDHAVPGAEVRCHRRQRLHQRLLEREQIEGLLAGGAVNAHAGFFRDPATRLRVQIRQIAEGAGGQEVAFDVFNAGLDDALLRRVCRRARINLEAVSFSALRVRALHERIAAAGARDRALRVIDDEPPRHLTEPLESASMQAEPRRHSLIEDELDILVTRETQRHHEGPRPAHR